MADKVMLIELSSEEEDPLEQHASYTYQKGNHSILRDLQQRPKRGNIFDFFQSSTSKKARVDQNAQPDTTKSNINEASNSALTVEIVDNKDEKLPYYLKNFLFIVDIILGSEEIGPLSRSAFSEEDLDLVKRFRLLPLDCQKMFARLFSRQKKWIQRSKIKYDQEFEPANSSNSILDKLVETKFIHDLSNAPLKHALKTLNAAQSKTLTTDLGFIPPNKGKVFSSQETMISHIMSLEKSCSHTIWQKKKDRCLQKCRELTGQCYSIPKSVKNVFLCIFLLFSQICDLTVHQQKSTQNSVSLQTQLYSLLETEKGNRIFPLVLIDSSRVEGFFDSVYRSPEELSHALWFYSKSDKMYSMMDRKQLPVEAAQKVLIRHHEVIREDQELAQLPKFQRSMSLLTIAKRALFCCAEVFEKNRNYKQAVDIFEILLDTNKTFAESTRRKIWPRLILDLDRHLRDPERAYQAALKALNEDRVLNLANRWEIEERVVKELSKRVFIGSEFSRSLILDVGEPRQISATIMSYQFDKVKNNFLQAYDDGSVQVVSVETVASDYFLNNEVDGDIFSEALHSEGRAFMAILGLLFWNEIYSPLGDDVPVFVTKFQSHPLDLFTGKEFYESRQSAIDEKLETIGSDDEGMTISSAIISKIWEEHENEEATLVSWSTFDGVDQCLRLLRAIGAKRLQFLMKTMISDLHFFRSGFPDLTIWDEKSKSLRFVEVKGPGDSLFAKQRVWLDLLRRNGFYAEMCRVVAVKSRKL